MTESRINNIAILGASSEIGQALARELVKRPERRILLASRSVLHGISSRDGLHLIHGLDFTVEADLLRLRAAVQGFFDEPFSVIHSVGDFWSHKPLVHTKFSEIRSMFESHYLTLSGATYAVLPTMLQRGGGHIIAFSCNSVSYNYPDMAPFTAAKAAIESLVRCLANEYSEYGIAMTALALPTIRTHRVITEKPQGDHANYLSPEELSEILIENVLRLPVAINGNVVKIFKHSRSFYNSSYFDRNPRLVPIVDQKQEMSEA